MLKISFIKKKKKKKTVSIASITILLKLPCNSFKMEFNEANIFLSDVYNGF